MRIFRDDCVAIHHYLSTYFETIKGYGKRLAELKDFYNTAIQTVGCPVPLLPLR